MADKIIFRQFQTEGGCNSFVIADVGTRKACIIDPRVDEQDNYAAYLAAHRLSVSVVIDTHTHADHYSGSHLVAEEFGARIAMSPETKSARADLFLKDGEVVVVGGTLGIGVLATPGHTPDSISLTVAQSGVTSAVFTGDTLFIGGSGRVDFPGADARAQYDSIHGRLGGLQDSTWVFPAHDYSGLLFSTIGHEKISNPHWLVKNFDEFRAIKEAELLDSAGILPQVLNFNLNLKPPTRPRTGAVTMCASACISPSTSLSRETVDSLTVRLSDKDCLVIDVCEPSEFKRSHIAQTRNIPLSELFMAWSELKSAASIVFVCQTGSRSRLAAQSVARLGLKNVSDLQGGYVAWIAAGKPVS